LDHGTPEWHAAWAEFARRLRAKNLGDGADLRQEHGGESWQYMGSERTGTTCRHTFRHRYHPTTKARVYVNAITRDKA
jgi:hypothetical protein